MRQSRCPFLATVVPLLLSCGGSAPTPVPDSSDPFVGAWRCTGMATTTYTAPPNTPPLVAATDATTSIIDDGGGALTIKRTPADGGVICTLHSHLGSDKRSITLDPGQTCMEDNGATLAYTMGRSSLNADGTYSNSASWTLTNMTKAGAPILGTGTATGVCTKTM